MSRRKFIAATGALVGFAGLTAGFLRSHRPQPGTPVARAEPPLPPDPEFPNLLRLPGADGLFAVADASGSFTLAANPARYPVLPGQPARVLTYEMERDGRTLLNPLLRVRSGTALRIKFRNGLDETSIIHWHGLKLDSNNDGHPHYAVPGGATYDYQFTVANRAGTYWYHPHPHHLTGKQVYHGLAGFFVVEDNEEIALQKALDLKLGVTDLPLVLQDRRFDGDGGLVYATTPEDRFHGNYASDVLVNWTRRPFFDATTRVYRFRILNGSNARLYRLAFRQGENLLEFVLVGTDGGLLERPHAIKEAFLAPGERIDVLLDLRGAQIRDEILLSSLPFDAMHTEMAGATKNTGGEHAHHSDKSANRSADHTAGHGDHAAGGSAQDGAGLDLLKIRIKARVSYDRVVPQTLSRMDTPATSTFSPRLIVLDQAKGRWRINGAAYDMKATPITVKRDTVETWDIRNIQPSMPHPMHVHGFQFRIISRTGSPAQQQRLAVTDAGLAAADLGWKDTVLIWPGETVRIVTDFSHPFRGDQVYMIHCHNLEHEDGGMMVNMKVAG